MKEESKGEIACGDDRNVSTLHHMYYFLNKHLTLYI